MHYLGEEGVELLLLSLEPLLHPLPHHVHVVCTKAPVIWVSGVSCREARTDTYDGKSGRIKLGSYIDCPHHMHAWRLSSIESDDT
jgi:hypothetical protein